MYWRLLKKISVTGGPAQTLCGDAGNSRGGTWSRDGVIVFAPQNGDSGDREGAEALVRALLAVHDRMARFELRGLEPDLRRVARHFDRGVKGF